MKLDLTTPALLFPTISLLLLAYTNRFIALGSRIRSLHLQYKQEKSKAILVQIKIFRVRVILIRDLQIGGIICLFFCVLTMFLIFEGFYELAKYVFGASLILMMCSFGLSAVEIFLSTKALNIQLRDLEREEKNIEQPKAW
jgi:hypothetical protein